MIKRFRDILNEKAPTPAMRKWIEHRKKEGMAPGLAYALAWKNHNKGKNYRSGKDGKSGSFVNLPDKHKYPAAGKRPKEYAKPKRFQLSKDERKIVTIHIARHLSQGKSPTEVAELYYRGMALGIKTRMKPEYVQNLAYEIDHKNPRHGGVWVNVHSKFGEAKEKKFHEHMKQHGLKHLNTYGFSQGYMMKYAKNNDAYISSYDIEHKAKEHFGHDKKIEVKSFRHKKPNELVDSDA